APTVVDFPAPGGPVTPMTLAGAKSPRASRTSLRRGLSTRLNNRPAARVDPLRAASMSSSMVIVVSLRSWNLDNGGRAHTTTRAHRGPPDATAAPTQFVYERDEHPCAGGGDRMAERASAAAGIDAVRVQVEQFDRGDAHRCERLVDLEQVDVGDRKPRSAKR